MPNVVVLGDKKDTRISDALVEMLSRADMGCLRISVDGVGYRGQSMEPARCVIADTDDPAWVRAFPANIVAIKSGAASVDLNGLCLAPFACAVIDGRSQPARNALVGSRLTAVSCGMGGRDTVTFSSIDKDHVILTIQRGLVDCFGNSVEEQDIPLDAIVLPGKEYNILAAAAICVMTGAGDALTGHVADKGVLQT